MSPLMQSLPLHPQRTLGQLAAGLGVAVVAALAMSNPAHAQSRGYGYGYAPAPDYVAAQYGAPPPVRYEAMPAARRGYAWVPGHWEPRGHRHVWVQGQWMRARTGYVYHQPRWQQRGNQWYWSGGRWDRR